MGNKEKIIEIVEKNNGILYSKELKKYNIHGQFLKQLEESGYLKKVFRGMYVKSDKNINEFFIMSERFPSGIYSHNTALYFHNLTDRTPLKLDMTFPSNIRVNNEYLKVHYIKIDNYSLGLTKMKLKDNTRIGLYDLERTICDIIRDRNKIDPQIFNTAMREYSKRKDKNLNLLYKYAKIFKIENRLKQYIDAFLNISNSWNLNKLERQATANQNFDDFILKESQILEYDNLKVLDVGCSNGFKTKMLFDRYENIKEIVGVDVDEKAIKEAKENFKNNNKYNFYLKDIYNLEEETKYDIICLSYILQHLKEPKLALKKLRNMLTDRGVILIKVPDDSFKFCFPDDEDLLHKIFDLYENEIMRKTEITKYTDRYIGKKIYNYLVENRYSNIKLYNSITDTVGKSKKERKELFDRNIAFRSATNRENVSAEIKQQMEEFLYKMEQLFEKDEFYFSMTVLYYIASK